MVSGRIKGFWRRVRNRHLFSQGNPSYADPGMDTPERAVEKRQDPASRLLVRQLDRLPTGSSASRTGASARAWRAVRLKARGGLRQLEQAPTARGGNVCVSRGIRLAR